MKRYLVATASSTVVLLSGGLHAQESTAVLGTVVITAPKEGGLPASSILTSVDVMGGDIVEDKNVMNSWELMGQMPGIQLTEFRLGAESGKPSFRAFNGEGYINGIKLLIDGVPSNVNSGNLRYMDLIFQNEIDYVEVVRGTNDPRYGLHNIGGSINMATKQGGNYSDARLSYGSFNTSELQAGLGKEVDGFSQNYSFVSQQSDGHRSHSDSEKYSFSGKWFYRGDGGRLKTGLIARLYKHDAQEAGYLTATQLRADRSQSPSKNSNDDDHREMSQISGHLDYELASNLMLTAKIYANSIEDDRHVTYTSNSASTLPRQRRFWDEKHQGMLSTLTWQHSNLLTLDGGVNYEQQDNKYRRYRYAYADPTNFSTPASTSNNEDYTVENLGAYIQAIIRPAKNWKVIPAYRVDKFDGNTTYNSTGVTYALRDYGWISQPKLSLVYSVSPFTSVYANWGRTFQILTGGTTAYQTSATNYRPSINTGQEVGMKFKVGTGSDARIALWQQDATDEVANLPSADATQNLGETRRRGVDLQFSSQVTKTVKIWASHSIQEAKIVGGYAVSGSSLVGKEVFSTPRYISNAGMEFQGSEKVRFGLSARAQGSYYIDDLNAQGKFGEYLLFDGSVRYKYSNSVSVDFQVKNILDEKYEYVWYDNFFWPAGSYQPMYSPGPGRAAYLALNMKF